MNANAGMTNNSSAVLWRLALSISLCIFPIILLCFLAWLRSLELQTMGSQVKPTAIPSLVVAAVSSVLTLLFSVASAFGVISNRSTLFIHCLRFAAIGHGALIVALLVSVMI
ncbi:MAG: hypothetical protein KDB03_27905 [Planctomycetales bacterium]|nr:hypothetical protein [Planctomycetales bacterium]